MSQNDMLWQNPRTAWGLTILREIIKDHDKPPQNGRSKPWNKVGESAIYHNHDIGFTLLLQAYLPVSKPHFLVLESLGSGKFHGQTVRKIMIKNYHEQPWQKMSWTIMIVFRIENCHEHLLHTWITAENSWMKDGLFVTAENTAKKQTTAVKVKHLTYRGFLWVQKSSSYVSRLNKPLFGQY